MATVKNTITMQDKMTPVFRSIIKAMESTVMVMAKVDGIGNKSFNKMKADIVAANAALDGLNSDMTPLAGKADKVGQSMTRWKNPIVTAASALQLLERGFAAVSKFMGFADTATLGKARINMINDGLQTTAQLQEVIYQSAQRARGAYSDTIAVVAKLGLMAKDSFTSNEETVAFAELMNKSFKVGGAGAQEQSAAMYQLTQAMASGRLQGDEFRSIMENAPMLAQAIADYAGVSMGKLREMSSEGLISSNMIKSAMFSAADDINKKFAEMPVTFAETMQKIKNYATQTFEKVFAKISEVLNGDRFAAFLEQMMSIINAVAAGFLWLLDTVMSVTDWFTTNWATIEPAVWGVGAAVLGLIVAWTTYKTLLPLVTAVQWALNAALNGNPIGIIIMGIALLIIALIAVGAYIYKLWQTNIDFRVGVIRIWNSILGFFDQVPIFFQMVGYGIADAFGSASTTVLKIMQGMANGVISVINFLIGALNAIPGVAIQPIKQLTFATEATVKQEAQKQARNDELVEARSNAALKAAYREADVQDYITDANKAAARAKLAEAVAKQEAGSGGGGEGFDFSKYLNDTPDIGNVGKVGSVGKIEDDVSISDEDIKLLKDIATVDFINKYTTLRPEMKVTFGDVHETADTDMLLGNLEDMVVSAYESVLSGGGA